MKILFISNHFSLPYQPGAPRPWKICDYFASLGHEVTVITNRRHYFDEKLEIGGTRDTKPQLVQGIRILGVGTTSGRRKSLFKRLVNYFSFAYKSYVVGRKIDRPDVIIVGTPPLIVPLTGLLLGRKHHSTTVLEIRDLFPETAVVLGKVRNRAIIHFWERWESFFRKRYDHIVAVVPRIRRSLISKGLSAEKVTTITNGFDVEHGETSELSDELDAFFYRYRDKFVVVYGGGMGYAIHLMCVVQAAEICSDKDIIFVFFGEGERKSAYMKYVKEKGLRNVFFFPPQPRLIINQVFRTASALVHSFIDNDFFECAFPNKIFEYHGAGRPIVFAGRGDTADLIRAAGSGIVVEPENPKQMAEAFRYLAANPEKADSMGKSGLEYIKKNYLREVVFQKWADVLTIPRENQ